MASFLLDPGLKLYILHFTEAYGNGIVSTCVCLNLNTTCPAFQSLLSLLAGFFGIIEFEN